MNDKLTFKENDSDPCGVHLVTLGVKERDGTSQLGPIRAYSKYTEAAKDANILNLRNWGLPANVWSSNLWYDLKNGQRFYSVRTMTIHKEVPEYVLRG